MVKKTSIQLYFETVAYFVPVPVGTGEIREKSYYHNIHNTEKSSSEILEIGTFFGTLES